MVWKTFFIEARVLGSRTVMGRITGCLLSGAGRCRAAVPAVRSRDADLAGIPIVDAATSERDRDMAVPDPPGSAARPTSIDAVARTRGYRASDSGTPEDRREGRVHLGRTELALSVSAGDVVASAPEGLAVIDADARFVEANPAAVRLCGLAPGAVPGARS